MHACIPVYYTCIFVPGSGVYATQDFRKGDFLVEYAGDLISKKEAERRERTLYAKHKRCYIYFFKHSEKTIWLVSIRILFVDNDYLLYNI
jgi:hypothetical protein